MKHYVVNSGVSNLSKYNLIRGPKLPEHVIIAIVDHDAYSGGLTKNPFNFQHYDIKEASLIVNGVNEPAELYKLDNTKEDKVDMYAIFLLKLQEFQLTIRSLGFY